MRKSDESRYATGTKASLRQTIRRPRILARRIQKRSSNTSSNIESAALDPKSYPTKKEDSGTDKEDDASRIEAIFGCAVLGELIRKNQPVPVTEHVPIFDNYQIRMRFGDEEDISDRVRMIGFALAEHALKAFRTVSKNDSQFQFTFPKEAAKINLNSADDQASVSQILSGSHSVEQDNSFDLSSQKRTIIRFKRTKSNDWEASTSEPLVRQRTKRKKFEESRADQRESNVVARKRKPKVFYSPPSSRDYGSSSSTSRGYGSLSTSRDYGSFPHTSRGCNGKRAGDNIATVERLNSKEKALVDQVLLLCSQFIRGINYADANWYSKLKMAIFLRLQQLVENMKNAVTKRRELRERNEELRRLRQHLIEQNRTNEPECTSEESLDDETTYFENKRWKWFAKTKLLSVL
ncbi:Alkylated DNA repair protein [Dirofilaria immitis]